MNKLKLSLVGCGCISRSHTRAFSEFADRCEIVWAADPDLERAKERAEAIGCRYTDDYRNTLDDVDAVILGTPHHLHAPHTIEAAQRGKHILVEKPMANSLQEADAMIRAADENGVILLVGLCQRYHPLSAKLKEILDAKTYGKPFLATMWTDGGGPTMTGWFTRKAETGGGCLHSHGSHYVDLLMWWLGEVADATCMRNRLMQPEMEAEDTAVMLMRFAGGALANYTCTWGNPYASSNCAAIIRCEKGQLFLDFKENTLRVTTDAGEEVLLDTPKYFPKIDQAQHFLDCIRDNKRPLTSGREARKCLETILSAYAGDGTMNF